MGARVPRRPGRLTARPVGAIRPVGAEPRGELLGPGRESRRTWRCQPASSLPRCRPRPAAPLIRLPRSPTQAAASDRIGPSVRPGRSGNPLVAAGLRWPALSPIPARARTSQGCQTTPGPTPAPAVTPAATAVLVAIASAASDADAGTLAAAAAAGCAGRGGGGGGASSLPTSTALRTAAAAAARNRDLYGGAAEEEHEGVPASPA